MKRFVGLLLVLLLAALATFQCWEPYLWQKVLNGAEKTESVTYEEIAFGTDVNSLIQKHMEKDGQDYELTDYSLSASEATLETKEIQERVTLYPDTDNAAEILGEVEKSIEYSKDGFAGTLYLDATEIRLEKVKQVNTASQMNYIFLSAPGDGDINADEGETDPSYRAELTYVGTVSKLEQGTLSAVAHYSTNAERDMKAIILVSFALLFSALSGLFAGLPSEKNERIKETTEEKEEPVVSTLEESVQVSQSEPVPEYVPAPVSDPEPEPMSNPEPPIRRNAHEKLLSGRMTRQPVDKGYVPSYMECLDRSGNDTFEEGGDR